jgi:ABC-2 type transport system permease protein
MPISDAQVVLSKVAVTLLIMPLGVLLLAAVTHVIVSGIFWIRFDGTVLGNIVGGWSFEGWFRALWASLLITVGGVLWYVPVAGYLLLVSVWARRAVFLWAVLPPAALMLLEKMFLHSEHVAEFVGRRLMGFVEEMDLRSGSFTHSPGDVQMPTIGEAYDAFSISGLFTHPELWVGLLAGAVLIAVTIRIRRYRDDS